MSNIKKEVKKYYGGIASRVNQEAINIYTKDTIESIIKSKNLEGGYSSEDVEMVDSAFAGALVKGIK